MVLIVEDDEASYQYLNTVLKKSGLKSIWATDGKQAINLCLENPKVNLILMDINLPVMNGYEATKKIKEIFPNLPIIAQTAYAISGDREKVSESGCDDYISKPISQETLIQKISKYLKN